MIDRVRAHFLAKGTKAFLVGGGVRDALLGRLTKDIDLAVDGNAFVVAGDLAASLGGHVVPLDEARNLVRVVIPERPGWAGSSIDVSSMPEGGIEADLAARDFTIDAMGVALSDGEFRVIDPFGGRADLDKRVIRAVTATALRTDPARLVRGPRLAAQLRFRIAEETADRIRTLACLATTVAPERLRDELLKLLAEPNAASSLRLADELGLLCRIVPELKESKGVTQPKEHYWDVFTHQIETVGNVELVVGDTAPSDPVVGEVPRFDTMARHFAETVSDGHTRLTLLKFAGLLHDVAKPATRTVEASGRIRFLGHHKTGADVAEGIARRLRFSRRGTEIARLMVQNHLRPGQMAGQSELPSGKAIFRYFRDVGDAAIDTLYLNLADYLAARGPLLEHDDWSEHCRIVGHVLHEGLEGKAPETLPKLISGHDIIGVFALEPGRQIGVLLARVNEAHAEGEITNKEEALKLVAANLCAGADDA